MPLDVVQDRSPTASTRSPSLATDSDTGAEADADEMRKDRPRPRLGQDEVAATIRERARGEARRHDARRMM